MEEEEIQRKMRTKDGIKRRNVGRRKRKKYSKKKDEEQRDRYDKR